MKKGKICFLVCMLMISATVVPISAQGISKTASAPLMTGTIFYVGGVGPNNYTTIQDAIDNASDGDTVFVFDDSSPYQENIIVDKSISLVGENRTTTVIDGGEPSDSVVLRADRVTLQGFTLTHTTGKHYGVRVGSFHNIIQGNIITNNMIGIHLIDVDANIIDDNILTENSYGGIYQYACDDTRITNNTISGVEQTGGVCIYYESHRALITYNTISGNTAGIAIAQSNDNTVSHNNVIGNTIGVDIDMGSNNLITQNNIQKNVKPVMVSGLSWHLATARWFHNIFDGNYWGRPTVLFKPILGVIILTYDVHDNGRMGLGFRLLGFLPVLKFDYHPAQTPYDLG
jgi:parallel beta-helix repeat protein